MATYVPRRKTGYYACIGCTLKMISTGTLCSNCRSKARREELKADKAARAIVYDAAAASRRLIQPGERRPAKEAEFYKGKQYEDVSFA